MRERGYLLYKLLEAKPPESEVEKYQSVRPDSVPSQWLCFQFLIGSPGANLVGKQRTKEETTGAPIVYIQGCRCGRKCPPSHRVLWSPSRSSASDR
jgi:hypothetical protein